VGEGAEGIAASSRGSENNGLGTSEAHYVGVSASKDRRRSKIAMGEGSEGIAASTSGGSKNNCPESCQAHHVGSSAQENFGIPASEMGEGKSAAEKGGVELREPAAVMAAGFNPAG
jgi:hypothetical protein